MVLIKFPHRVKVDGVYYDANTPVKVKDAHGYMNSGAVVIEEITAAPDDRPVVRRPRKKPETEIAAE